eukprot:g1511.t1
MRRALTGRGRVVYTRACRGCDRRDAGWSAARSGQVRAFAGLDAAATETFYGSPIDPTVSEDAVNLFVYSVDSYINSDERNVRILDQSVDTDGGFVRAHCLRGILRVLDEEGAAGRVSSRRRREVDEILQIALNAVESSKSNASPSLKLHDIAYVNVLEAFSENRPGDAAEMLDELLLSCPHDLLTMKLAYDTYDAIGDIKNKRYVVPRVIERWSDGVMGYSKVLALHAAALVDDGAFVEAEDLGMRALSIDPQNLNAMVAAASAMLAQCRPREAVRLLREFRDAWKREESAPGGNEIGSKYEQRLGWLWALGEIEQGQYENAFHRFRSFGCVGTTSGQGPKRRPWNLVDGVSLLHRLRMCGVDVDDPWTSLAQKYDEVLSASIADSNDDIRCPLFDAHLVLLFTYAGMSDRADDVIRSRRARTSGDAAAFVCEGMRSVPNDPETAANVLRPVRFRTKHVLGGYHAHRDMFEWALLDCCVRGDVTKWGRAIASERLARSPGSAHSWRLYAELLHAEGSAIEADEAYVRALDLGLGQGGSKTH